MSLVLLEFLKDLDCYVLSLPHRAARTTSRGQLRYRT